MMAITRWTFFTRLSKNSSPRHPFTCQGRSYFLMLLLVPRLNDPPLRLFPKGKVRVTRRSGHADQERELPGDTIEPALLAYEPGGDGTRWKLDCSNASAEKPLGLGRFPQLVSTDI